MQLKFLDVSVLEDSLRFDEQATNEQTIWIYFILILFHCIY